MKVVTASLNTAPGLLRLGVPVQAHPGDVEVQSSVGLSGLQGGNSIETQLA